MPRPEGTVLVWSGEEVIRPRESIELIDFSGRAPQTISYDHKEFSAVCPFSGLPDTGRVFIELVPGDWIPELKSLKYYLISFRSVGIYQEAAADRIFRDLVARLVPRYLKVVLAYSTRGGIDTVSSLTVGDYDEALKKPEVVH